MIMITITVGRVIQTVSIAYSWSVLNDWRERIRYIEMNILQRCHAFDMFNCNVSNSPRKMNESK